MIEDNDLGLKEIERRLSLLGKSFTEVGIHEDETHDEGLSTAMVGAFHEFGTRTVPQRSFLASTVDDKEREIRATGAKVIERVVDGTVDVATGVGLLGETGQQLVQETIRESHPDWPPLTEATKRKKARKGRLGAEASAAFVGSDGNPLVDTGQLIQSIRHKPHVGKG